MFLFKNTKKLMFKTLCLVLLSSFTLNLYPLGFLGGIKNYISKVKKQYKKPHRAERTEQEINAEKEFKIKKILGPVNYSSTSIITDNEWEELEVDKIVEKWKTYTKTNFDIWGIEYLLKNAPAGSKEILKTLAEKDEAFNILDNIIDKFKAAEEPLISYYENYKKMNKSKIHNNPKIAPAINSIEASTKIQSLLFAWKTVAAPILSIFSLIGGNATIIDYFKSKINKNEPFGWGNNFIHNFKKIFIDINPIPAIHKPNILYHDRKDEDTEHKKTTLGDNCILNNIIMNEILGNTTYDKDKKITTVGNNKFLSRLAWTVSIPASLFDTLWLSYIPFRICKYSIETSLATQKACTKMRADLISITDLLKSLNQLKYILLKDKTKDIEDISVLTNIKKALDIFEASEDVKKLFKLLDSPTFTDKNTSWYSRGTVLAADNLLKKVYPELIPLLQNIACLGGYRAIAKMVKESQKQEIKAKFCFVEKVDSETPIIDLKNAWYPLLDSEQVVPNDISLGNNSPQNAILTGPNGGGKSITMMTAGFNALLQQLGIAAAESAKMTDFARIITSSPKQSNQDTELFSRGEYEIIRKYCIDKMLESCAKEKQIVPEKPQIRSEKVVEIKENNQENNNLAPKSCNRKTLILLDEPCSGTIDSENDVYDLCKKNALENKNCAMMVATHTIKSSKLESDDETIGLFKNYQMGIKEEENSIFKKEFKLLDGYATWWGNDTNGQRTRYKHWLEKTTIHKYLVIEERKKEFVTQP